MKEINFEETMSKLEKIIDELENGNLNLDDSIKKFEEGIKLSKACNDFLENAEKRITLLVKNGNGVLEEEF